MKKFVFFKNITLYLLTLGILFLQSSCNEDESYDVKGDTENKVYIKTQSWAPIDAPQNSILFDVTNTPVGSIVSGNRKVELKLIAQCTQNAKTDVLVSFKADNSLISEGYETIPGNINLSMNKTELVIPRGETKSSDSLKVAINTSDLQSLANGTYMVPIKISSVSNAGLSINLMSAYLIVKTSYSNCEDQATGVSGAETSPSGWTAYVNGQDQKNKLFDGNRSTYFSGSRYTLEVDLGAVHENITGLKMDFYRWYYAMGSANIYTSETDTNEYTLQGSPTFPSEGSQYVSFYQAIKARYIKVEVTSPSYSDRYGTAITEFHLFQQ